MPFCDLGNAVTTTTTATNTAAPPPMSFLLSSESVAISWNGTLRGAALHPSIGYWGVPTSTVDWCESNYEHSVYIAEFWNTLSNVFFVIFGIYGFVRAQEECFEWRFRLLFVSMTVIGVGSAMFHGTLQLVHQQFDETPMIWGMLVWIYTIYDDEIRRLGIKDQYVIAALVGSGVVFAVLHAIYQFTLFFQFLFGVLVLACFVRIVDHYHTVRDRRARRLAAVSLSCVVLGVVCWTADYHLCSEINSALPFNPQAHAWWHFLMSIGTYSSPVFMQFVHADRLRKRAEIVDTRFGLATIVIHSDPVALKKKKL